MLVKKVIIILIEIMQYKDALQQIQYYLRIYTQFFDLYFLEANCHLECGRYSKAKMSLEKYMNNRNLETFYPTQAFVSSGELYSLANQIDVKCICNNNVNLSVCIIVKNEYDLLMKCIKSVNEIANEIVVIDTGSNDKSDILANQYGADVYHYQWSNNFSDVRNYAIKKAAGDWVLFIDADEILPQQSKKQLVNLLLNPQSTAYNLNIITFLDQKISYSNSLSMNSCRLFKNNRYKYYGCIYESINKSIIESNKKISFAQIKIFHLHYLRTIEALYEKRQIKWDIIQSVYNKQLMLESYTKSRESFFCMDFLSTIKYSQKYYILTDSPLPEMCLFYSIALYHNDQYSEAIDILQKGLKLYSDYTDLIYIQALCYYKLSNYDEAEKLFLICIEVGESPWNKYVTSIGSGSFKAKQSLVILYMKQSRYDEALLLLGEITKLDYTRSFGLTYIINYYIERHLIADMLEYFVKYELYTIDNLVFTLKYLISIGEHNQSSIIIKDISGRMHSDREFIKKFCEECNVMLKDI